MSKEARGLGSLPSQELLISITHIIMAYQNLSFFTIAAVL